MLQPFDDALLDRCLDARDDAAAHLAAIDDAMRAAEAATSWPRFVTVLRACGPGLREHLLELLAHLPDHVPTIRPPLSRRLQAAGMSDELREQVAHAERTLERARGIGHLLSATRNDEPEAAAEHEREGDKAAWMHAFATILLHRVASGQATLEQPSTGFAVTLAVDAARDAYAHWATALELRARVEAA